MSGLLPRLRDALRPEYEVRSELAAGGMARVFLARDTALERDVAVKVLRPELATADGAERFLREARLLARVAHPNVVAVHEVGERGGLFYCVLERVEGSSLEERLREGPLTPEEAIRVADGLLAALGAAHAEGVVHRDVKPANVVLGEDDRVVLVDFGVARALESTDPRLTAPEARPGTPGWMAPEQLAGEPATPRTDLYAVARVAYEAITGRGWTPGADPGRADWSEVPSDLTRALARGLAPAPEDRWPDAESFRRALSGERGRRRWPAAAAALLALGLVGAVLLTSDGGDAAASSPAYDVAVVPCEPVAAGDSVLGEQVARVASLYLEHLPRLRVVPHFRAFRWWNSVGVGADDPYRAAAREFDASHVVRCTVEPGDAGRLRIAVEPIRRDGTVLPPTSVEAAAASPPVDAGDALGLAIVRALRPRLVLSEEGHTALAGHDREAQRAFLLGEDAFQRDARRDAAEYYRAALDIDSSLALARWRLVDLRRYLLLPGVEEDLAILAEAREELGPVDRLMLEARLAPPGPERLARYRELLERFPGDPYALFTYGDELFHRGPLAGIGQDSALVVLRAAARRDSLLAPAHDHLAMALIRAGERVEAERVVAWLAELKGEGAELGVDHPAMLRLAWLERFEPARAAERRNELFGDAAKGASAEVLAEAARLGGPYMDLPRTEVALGRALSAGADTDAGRATGLVAEGLGLAASGRWEDALERFDRAALADPRPATRLHAALWRVVPPALGIAGVPPDERQRGVAALQGLLAAGAPAPLRARATWALGLDALVRGDREAAARRSRELARSDGVGGLDRARSVLAAWTAASDGRPLEALAGSEPVLAYRAEDRTEWPFLQSALHLGRGRWLAETGRSLEADRALLWHEAIDLAGGPTGGAQAGEVGWVLGAHADLERARLHRDGGRTSEACRLAERVLYRWERPDGSLAPALAEARAIRGTSCPS